MVDLPNKKLKFVQSENGLFIYKPKYKANNKSLVGPSIAGVNCSNGKIAGVSCNNGKISGVGSNYKDKSDNNKEKI